MAGNELQLICCDNVYSYTTQWYVFHRRWHTTAHFYDWSFLEKFRLFKKKLHFGHVIVNSICFVSYIDLFLFHLHLFTSLSSALLRMNLIVKLHTHTRAILNNFGILERVVYIIRRFIVVTFTSSNHLYAHSAVNTSWPLNTGLSMEI